MTKREELGAALMRTWPFEGVPDQHLAPVLHEAIDAFLDALSEPSSEMVKAGRASVSGHMRSEAAKAVWQAMLSAAKWDR